MTEPFVGEISIFAGSYAPSGWALCNGQLLPISQNPALFSILGTIYGGNGTTNFGLPNLQSRIPVQAGQGPGLSNYQLGQMSGVETVTLNLQQLAAHNHTLNAISDPAESNAPGGHTLARSRGITPYGSASGNTTPMSSSAIPSVGNVNPNPHENRSPYLALNFIIALQGVYPSRP